MAFEFSGKLPREQQPMSPALSSMERLEKMITERLKNMEASTKHSLFAGIMALAGVAMPLYSQLTERRISRTAQCYNPIEKL